MRLMNWNIEHMNSWWEPGNAAVMRTTFGGSSFSPPVGDVPGLARRVGNVIDAIAPDVITIQEGAGLPEMTDFFDRFVSGGPWRLLRGSGGRQALVVAAREGGAVTDLAPGPTVAGDVDLEAPIEADVDADLLVNDVEFAREPQVVTLTAHGRDLLLLNNHLKSKFVRNGRARFDAGGLQQLSFFRDALLARRRISAEAFRIREYLDRVLTDDPDRHVILTGDLNDGEGADFFEQRFLTHSVVDRVFGSIFHPERRLTHALLEGGSTDFTAQFFDFMTNQTRDLVIDHVGISHAIDRDWTWTGRVAVAEYGAETLPTAAVERDRVPSDHRPVVWDGVPA